MNKQSKCPVCRHYNNLRYANLFDDRYGYLNEFLIVRCLECSHFFVKDAPKNDELSDLYTNFYPRASFDVDAFKPYKQSAPLKNWLVGGKSSACQSVAANTRVLDIGCGYGETLAYMEAKGCDVYGVDADRNVAEVAKRYGFKIHIGIFDNGIYKKNFFDYVTMNQVIEHVTDPHQVLKNIHEVLKPGGFCVLSTPNANGWGARIFGWKWLNWHVPYHQQFFSEQSIQLLATEHGFTVDKIQTVTRSEWIMYQILHVVNYPKQGAPSGFWSPTRVRKSMLKNIIQKVVVLSQFLLIPQLVTRFFDAIGVGDNYLIILRKR